MSPANQPQLKIAYMPGNPMPCRWLSALTPLQYRTGHLAAYLTELVSALRHGLGASRVMIGQRSQTEGYHFIMSPELLPGATQNLERWLGLTQDILAHKMPGTGLYTIQPHLAVAYCGVPLQTVGQGILLALRPAIEPFRAEDQQVLTLMAAQATMAIQLENCSQSTLPRLGHPSQLVQDKLLTVNQQLTQKLDQYRVELQAVSARLQMESIAHSSLEQRFRKIFEGSNDAIFVIDPAQDQILEANPRAAQQQPAKNGQPWFCVGRRIEIHTGRMLFAVRPACEERVGLVLWSQVGSGCGPLRIACPVVSVRWAVAVRLV